MKDTLTIDGYTVTIQQDECPENPFEAWDYEPPLLTYYGGRHGNFKSYNGPESLSEIIDLLPWSFAEHEQAYPGTLFDSTQTISPDPSPFERGRRVQTIKDYLDCSLKEFAETRKYSNSNGTSRDAFRYEAEQKYGSRPAGWSDANAWFETASSLLTEAGIPNLCTRSCGYCQGDVTLCLVILTDDWFKMTGANRDNAKEICQATVDLYSAWAWGDVYGVAEITDPDGNEIEDAACWGYYGSDHDKSGLLDHARSIIEHHKTTCAA